MLRPSLLCLGLFLSVPSLSFAQRPTLFARDIQAVFSRRQSPEDSLFLLKAVGSVPHRGGKRTSIGSPEYETSGVNGLLGIDSDTIPRTPSGRPVKIIPGALSDMEWPGVAMLNLANGVLMFVKVGTDKG